MAKILFEEILGILSDLKSKLIVRINKKDKNIIKM